MSNLYYLELFGMQAQDVANAWGLADVEINKAESIEDRLKAKRALVAVICVCDLTCDFPCTCRSSDLELNTFC